MVHVGRPLRPGGRHAAAAHRSAATCCSPPEPSKLEAEPVLEEFHFAQERTGCGRSAERRRHAATRCRSRSSKRPTPSWPTKSTRSRRSATSKSLDINQTILQVAIATENLLIKGAGSAGTVGAAGAVDRITNEILLSLDERPTLVVWLFDQSGSLKAQRESIAKRFDRVYDELGMIEASGNPAFRRHDDKPLLTAVASFGETVESAHARSRPTTSSRSRRPSARSATIPPAARTCFNRSTSWPTSFATIDCKRRGGT